ncbi:MAG TPA: elongation factor P [Candidatus Hydrogenedentes bacterium]|nr:elongation factor P [Candidatus Hydrogenedentota bacterium]HNT88939.1 elongation factor P [Candidatus Hydrogenedentota bacterium]
MAAISDFRTGMAIRHNNDIWIITEFQHVTPGNWRAMVRTKLKNLKTGRVIDVTFRMTDKIEEIRLESKPMQFLYEADGSLHFMDNETYDQLSIPDEMLGDQKQFLKEGNTCTISFLEGRPISAEIPLFVELVVAEAEPAVRGDSATNIMKFAVLETGAQVQVPLFVKEGDTLKIDTRTGKYIERMSKG